jgi:hypothetical protein
VITNVVSRSPLSTSRNAMALCPLRVYKPSFKRRFTEENRTADEPRNCDSISSVIGSYFQRADEPRTLLVFPLAFPRGVGSNRKR